MSRYFSMTLLALALCMISVFGAPINIQNQEYVRNGEFEQEKTGWGAFGSLLTGIDNGKTGQGYRLQSEASSNYYAFVFQELFLPTSVTSAQFSYDCMIGATMTPYQFGFYKVSLCTHYDIVGDPNNELVTLHQFQSGDTIPGGWNESTYSLSSNDIASIESARNSGKRIFLMALINAQNIDAIIDNMSLSVSGSMDVPSVSGNIAYLNVNGDFSQKIYTIQPDGSAQSKIWEFPQADPTGVIYDLAWNPTGSKLAFSSKHENGYSLYRSDVFEISSNGSGIRRVTNSPGLDELNTYAQGNVTGSIHNDTTSYVTLALYLQGAAEPVTISLGPSGSSTETVDFAIDNVADLFAGAQTLSMHGTSTSWNGTEIAAGGVDVIAGQMVNAGTFTYHGYSSKYEVTDICWNRDGTMIGYNLDTILKTVDVSTRDMGTLVDFSAFTSSPAWSPVDDRVIYEQTLPSDKVGLYLTNVNTAEEGSRLVVSANIASGPTNPCWLPDGSGFLFQMWNAGTDTADGFTPFKMTRDLGADIFLYTISSGTYMHLTDFYNEYVEDFSVSPDGKYIVFDLKNSQFDKNNLWIMKIPVEGEKRMMWQLTWDNTANTPAWGNSSVTQTSVENVGWSLFR